MTRESVISTACFFAALSLRVASAKATETGCGSTLAGWNVPNGGVVFNRAAGPISDVLTAAGEWRTHSMLSHGPGSGAWVSHATMRAPEQNSWPMVCGQPLEPNKLASGYPGVSQVNQGGIFQVLYGNTDPSQNTTWIAYQLGDAARAARVADHLWYDINYFADRSVSDATVEIDRRIWEGIRDDRSATAVSISPDRIGGWSGHPVGTTTWSFDVNQPVFWNSGGNVYGCWL